MTADPTPILSLQRVGRTLAGRDVVRGVSLELRRGEVLGLLGVNGAGKTTTLKMIAGVLAPSTGTVLLDGHDLHDDPARGRRRIGYLPETPPLHAELGAEEFLAFCARLHGIERRAVRAVVERTLDRCELGDVARRPMGTLSKGLRQRVGLAQAILHEPALIVLDEPASGLDPVQALKLRDLVRSLARDHAVVLSTHALPDVVACCDRVAILQRGELRHEGPLVRADGERVWRVGVARVLGRDAWAALPAVDAVDPVEAAERRQWRVRLRAGVPVAELAAAIVAHGFGLEELRAERSALESLFLAIAAADPASSEAA